MASGVEKVSQDKKDKEEICGETLVSSINELSLSDFSDCPPV